MKRLIISAVLTACVLSAGYLAVSAITESQPKNPCAGVSDEECKRLISNARAEFDAKYTAWIEEVQRSGIDLEAVPRAPMEIQYLDWPANLHVAVQRADIILVARATSIRFVPLVNAEITLSVERLIKGEAEVTSEMNILLPGELRFDPNDPSPEWKLVAVGQSEGAPLLWPGDRALLFLEEGSGVYTAQPITGHYRLEPGEKLSALPSNPFASEADGKPLDEFLATVTQALAQPAAP